MQRAQELTLCLEHEEISQSAEADLMYTDVVCSDVVDHAAGCHIQHDGYHRIGIARERPIQHFIQARAEDMQGATRVDLGTGSEGRSNTQRVGRARARPAGKCDVMREIRRSLGMADRANGRGGVVASALLSKARFAETPPAECPPAEYPPTEHPSRELAWRELTPHEFTPSTDSSRKASGEISGPPRIDWHTGARQARGEVVSMGDREVDALLGGGLLCGALHEFQGCASPFACDVPFGAILHVVRCAVRNPALADRPVIWIGDRVCPPCMTLHSALVSRVVARSCDRADERSASGSDVLGLKLGDLASGDLASGDLALGSLKLDQWVGHDLSEHSIAVSDHAAVRFAAGASGLARPRRSGRVSACSASRHRSSDEGATSPASVRAWCAERALRLEAAAILVIDAAGMDVSAWRRLQLAASACASPVLVLMVSSDASGGQSIDDACRNESARGKSCFGFTSPNMRNPRKGNPSATCWRTGGEAVSSIGISEGAAVGLRFEDASREIADLHELSAASALPESKCVHLFETPARRWTMSLQGLRGRAAAHASKYGRGGVHQAIEAGIAVTIEEDIVGGRGYASCAAPAASSAQASDGWCVARANAGSAIDSATRVFTGGSTGSAIGSATGRVPERQDPGPLRALGHVQVIWSASGLTETHDFLTLQELPDRSRQSVA